MTNKCISFFFTYTVKVIRDERRAIRLFPLRIIVYSIFSLSYYNPERITILDFLISQYNPLLLVVFIRSITFSVVNSPPSVCDLKPSKNVSVPTAMANENIVINLSLICT